jgi:hypothetical protein
VKYELERLDGRSIRDIEGYRRDYFDFIGTVVCCLAPWAMRSWFSVGHCAGVVE